MRACIIAVFLDISSGLGAGRLSDSRRRRPRRWRERAAAFSNDLAWTDRREKAKVAHSLLG